MVEETSGKGKVIKIKLPNISKINIWRVLSIIFAFIILVQLFGFINLSGFLGLPANTSQQIGEKVINYINQNLVQPGTSVSLVSINDKGSFYEIITNYQGNRIPVYASKDGKYLWQIMWIYDMSQPLPRQAMEGGQATQEIPKTDKPKVQLYIFSYCPYGVSALDSLSEVANFLKGYADFETKFFSHMHGEYERQQNMIQECIQKLVPDKYWAYAKQYSNSVYQKCVRTRSLECDKNESIVLMDSVGINSSKIMECVEKEGEKYYQQDIQDANRLGLTGSPSFVINGVYVRNIDRSPEGIKSAVCSAFNTPPEKCSQKLSGSSSSVSGSC
ncbi:MAG: hypothetical protein QW040_02335 [Candidatus Aenigmatarchaeota archaeon]